MSTAAHSPADAPRRREVPARRLAAIVAVLVIGGLATAAVMGGIGAPGGGATGAPRFVDVTAGAGIEHVYDGEFPYFVGGGIAAFDCDGDDRPELYVAGGAQPAALFRNRSTAGTIRFERAAATELAVATVTGAYPLDLDGDDRIDLAVLRNGASVLLLRGTGDCAFEPANDALGFDGDGGWNTAFSATWEPGALLPTLALGSYLALEADGSPSRERCGDNRLVRPVPGEARYAAPVLLEPGFCTLSMLFSDWDRSGRRDLRVSNDRHYTRDGIEQLWRIDPGRAPRSYGPDDGWQPLRIWGMGIASQDLDGDAYPEVYLTSQGDNKLQTLAAEPTRPEYRDIALDSGATAHRPYTGGDVLPSTAWHAEFDDVNDDGLPDLFVAKGNVEAQVEYARKDPSNLLLGQPDGMFVEAGEAAGIVSFGRARGAALEDLDLDGRLDLVVVNRREPVRIWRNEGVPGSEHRWAAVRLVQPGPNRAAVGAWLEIRRGERTEWRELTVGGGHAGGQAGWIHLGLGGEDAIEVRVHWPDGATDDWRRLDTGRHWVMERGAAPRIVEPAG